VSFFDDLLGDPLVVTDAFSERMIARGRSKETLRRETEHFLPLRYSRSCDESGNLTISWKSSV